MARKKFRGRNLSGLLLLDKPPGLTSNQALQEVKKIFFAKKAGHTGSLDPIATGILPICFGEATKFSQFLLDTDKKYQITCRLGTKTTSQDSQGEITETLAVPDLTPEQIKKELKNFLGPQMQTPPMHSAIKVNGKPLYKLAHQGKEIERQARPIEIYSFEMVKILDKQTLLLEVHCSKGTYARTLIADLGDNLGCGAHVSGLRRTGFGAFNIEETVSMDKIHELYRQQDDFTGLNKLILPVDETLRNIDKIELSPDEKFYILQGQPIQVNQPVKEGLLRMYFKDEFIGIGQILDDGRLGPKRLIKRENP